MNNSRQRSAASVWKQTSEACIDDLVRRHPALDQIRMQITDAADLLLERTASGGRLLVCGNGGSAADADHIIGELMKSFRKPRPINRDLADRIREIGGSRGEEIAGHLQDGLPAVALTQHTALNSAFSNDVAPTLGFAQQVCVLGGESDLLWGLSTSGNSENVVCAAVTAKARGMKVLGMTGAGGGTLEALCDVCIRVPEEETYKVQELHLPIYHTLCIILEECFW